MGIPHNPDGRMAATYSHGIEVRGEVRTLYISGQIGTFADGSIAEGITAQSHAVFENLSAVLESAGMTFENVVKTTVFLTRREDFPAFAQVRKARFGALKPASTLLFVSGLAHPDLLVEVEAIAVVNA
ncbi:RidA family protein [Phyllobacterium sp. P5_D12]